MSSCFMNNDRYGQAVGRDKSKEIASKYTPYEAFLTKLEELDVQLPPLPPNNPLIYKENSE